MNYARYGNIDDYVKNYDGKLPEILVIQIFLQICMAVCYSHSKDVIHRDI